MAHKAIEQQQREVFFLEMELCGFMQHQTEQELEILENCNTELDYIKASRVGKTVKINRAQRKEIFSHYTLWMREGR